MENKCTHILAYVCSMHILACVTIAMTSTELNYFQLDPIYHQTPSNHDQSTYFHN